MTGRRPILRLYTAGLRGGCYYDERVFAKRGARFDYTVTETLNLLGVRLVRCIRRDP
jgi:hypothetical protein